MAVKFSSKEKRDEYVRSLKQAPAVVPPAPQKPAPQPKAAGLAQA
jgi:hypothetical protein